MTLQANKANHHPQSEEGWAGHWLFNTNESFGRGAYQRMFERQVAAIYGYPDGPRKLQGAKAGEQILAYVNQQGVQAVGIILNGDLVKGQGIFLNAEGEQQPDEYHLAVRWEAMTAREDALTAAEAIGLGYQLPVRSTFAKLYRGQIAERLVQALHTRATQKDE